MEKRSLLKLTVFLLFLFALIFGIKSMLDKEVIPLSPTEVASPNRDSLLLLAQQKEKDTAKLLAEKKKHEREEVIKKAKQNFRVEYDDIQKVYFFYDKTSPRYNNQNGIYAYLGMQENYDVFIRFKVQYVAEDWLFIQKMTFKIDDNIYSYTPSEVKRDNDGGIIWEWFDIPASDVDIQPIITALRQCESAKIRFEGSDYYKDKVITKSQINALKKIYELRYKIEDI